MHDGEVLDDDASPQHASLQAEVRVVASEVLGERLVEAQFAHCPRRERHEKAVDHVDVLRSSARELAAPSLEALRSGHSADAAPFPPSEAAYAPRTHDSDDRDVRFGQPSPELRDERVIDYLDVLV